MTDTQKKTVIILDAHGEYRDIMHFFSPQEMVWMRAGDELGINPCQVPVGPDGRPAMPPDKWVGYLKEWMRMGWLGEVSVNFFAKVVLKLYKDRGIFDGSQDYLCLSDILEAAELVDAPKASDMARAREKTVDRLGSIVSMLPGLDVRKSRDVHQLFGQHSVILDMTEVKDSAVPLLFNFLVMLLTASFTHEQDGPISRLFVMEEAHLLLGGQADRRMSDLKESAGTGVLRSLRKAGFCGAVVNQTVSDLAPAVVGNLSSIISMRLAQRACISKAGSALSLERWQEQELARLPMREAVMKVSRYPDPIHLLVKDIKNV